MRDFYVTHNVNSDGFTIQLIWSTINTYFYIPLILIEFVPSSCTVTWGSFRFMALSELPLLLWNISCGVFSDTSRKRGISEGTTTGRVVENSCAVYGQRTLTNDGEAQGCGELLPKFNGAVQKVRKLFRIGGNL